MSAITTVGLRVKELRMLRGWSAQQVSDATNGAVTRWVISDLETGRKQHIELEQAFALAHVFGLSVYQIADVDLPTSALVLAAEIAAARQQLREALSA